MEIHRRMLAQYGQRTMSEPKVYEWLERFKSDRTRVTDEGHSGRPSTSRSRKASSPQEYRNYLNDIKMHCVARGLCRKMICKIDHSYSY